MNPANPTRTEVKATELLFFEQMKLMTKRATSAQRSYNSFDLQFSDRWIPVRA